MYGFPPVTEQGSKNRKNRTRSGRFQHDKEATIGLSLNQILGASTRSIKTKAADEVASRFKKRKDKNKKTKISTKTT